MTNTFTISELKKNNSFLVQKKQPTNNQLGCFLFPDLFYSKRG